MRIWDRSQYLTSMSGTLYASPVEKNQIHLPVYKMETSPAIRLSAATAHGTQAEGCSSMGLWLHRDRFWVCTPLPSGSFAYWSQVKKAQISGTLMLSPATTVLEPSHKSTPTRR